MKTVKEVNSVTRGSARSRKPPAGRLLRPPKPPEKLKAERVQETLRSMPGWVLSSDGGSLSRVRDFGSTQLAAGYAGFVMSAAGLAKRSVEVSLSDNLVGITIFGVPQQDGARGLTRGILELARWLG